MKQNKTYLQSKIRHILTCHSSSTNICNSSLNCPTCQQIELTDYDFLLIDRERFIELVREVERKERRMGLEAIVDRVMEESLLGRNS
jgi:hypothetical protein